MNTKDKILRAFSAMSEEQLRCVLKLYAQSIKQQQSAPAAPALTEERFFTVPSHKKEFIEDFYGDISTPQGRWVAAVKALPEHFTLPPYSGRELIERARAVWQENIRGLEEVFDKLLLHIVRYSNTKQMRPLLFVGEPGCGKTTVAKLVASMLGLPSHFISGPRCVSGRGLSGSGEVYVGSDVGELVKGCIDTGCANPGYIIDEVDKIPTFSGHGGTFVDELLTVLDSSNSAFVDNMLQFPVDLSRSIFILTANELDKVSEPLVSRCDVIMFPRCSEQQKREIVRDITLPAELEKYGLGDVQVDPGVSDRLVDELIRRRVTDLRKYQSAVESLVSSANLRHIKEDCPFEIMPSDLEAAAAGITPDGDEKRAIGFSA